MFVRLLAFLVFAGLLAAAAVYVIGTGALGVHRGVSPVNQVPVPAEFMQAKAAAQQQATALLEVAPTKQILFGDLHVHSTFSTDAFMLSLPTAGGEGAHPVSDACDFARYCSALDFWSINDHALSITPQRWQETKAAIRQCNAVSAEPENPDVVAFLGWEWTNIGRTPDEHWGHKNVVLRDLAEDQTPARPITTSMLPGVPAPTALQLGLLPLAEGFNQDTFDEILYLQEMSPANVPACEPNVPVRELPLNCMESAPTPRELFAKLDDWGHAAMVIPHGTTWGFYTPAGASWDKQLSKTYHDPTRQFLLEVYSGHGNSEEYRSWKEFEVDAQGNKTCPKPRPDYLPGCWRAGEIIGERCAKAGAGANECARRVNEAQQNYLKGGVSGFRSVPATAPNDWLDAGQCKDCFQPAFNYRPKSSAQYILALRNFDDDAPQRFRFGLMASSDNHTGRPGTGYKEYARTEMTEARFGALAGNAIFGGKVKQEPEAKSVAWLPQDNPRVQFFGQKETERQGSFFVTGGLIAAHSASRDRGAIWDALQRKEVYGTSGPRILLWFDLVKEGEDKPVAPMGASVTMHAAPTFQVKALGSFDQNPGCPDYSRDSLTPERLHYLCRNECYNPSDVRRPIARIEVVRIRPQRKEGEAIEQLIEDPWRVFDCKNNVEGCKAIFSDEEFGAAARDTVYYARAIEAESLAVNAANVRCEYDKEGNCEKANVCNSMDPAEDCLAPTEQRAWSSPIFVDYKR